MAKSVSRTSGSQTSKQKSVQTSNQNKNGTTKATSNQKQWSKSGSDSHVTNWATTDQTGGSRSVSYKDLSGLSPETLALQQKVYNNIGYTPSQAVQNAYGKKSAAEQAVLNYGDFKYNHQEAMERTLNDLLSRKPFNYNFNEDALYQQYRDSYERQGKQAAQNAAAAASALSGGYGNSYATSAANQANEEYMTQLNDRIPELYRLALERYNTENQDMINLYNVLGSQYDREFNTWNTGRQNLAADRDYAGSDYHSEQSADMTAQQNLYNNALALLNYRTGLEAKDVTDGSNWSNTVENGGSDTHTESYENSGSKSKEKTTTKEKIKNKSTDTSTSVSSSSSVTNTSSTGSGKGKGSSGVKVNNLSGTKTSLKNVQEAYKTFKDKANDRRNTDTREYDQKALSEAYDYLMDRVNSKFINKDDMQWIYESLGIPMPTNRR